MFGPSRARRDTMASADFPTRVGISRDKQTCFRCIHAGCTQSRVMGTRFQTDRRPNLSLRASYPVSVRHVASVTKASSRPVLTHSPLPSYIGPVPKTEGDLHPRATSHARRTYTCYARTRTASGQTGQSSIPDSGHHKAMGVIIQKPPGKSPFTKNSILYRQVVRIRVTQPLRRINRYMSHANHAREIKSPIPSPKANGLGIVFVIPK